MYKSIRMKKLVVLSLILSSMFCVAAINITQAIFDQKMNLPKGATFGQSLVTIARSFEGQPYKAHTLESTPEQLVCNLQEFDCATFVENVLALTLTQQAPIKRFIGYQQNLQKLRYRDAKIDNYASRLHYFLEWKLQAEKNKIVRDITADLGGEKVNKTIDFMSKHATLYPALADSVVLQQIRQNEVLLNQSQWAFIPKAKVKSIESKLQNGDIVAITSGVEGLDFNHEGFVLLQKGVPYLLHASSENKKVMVSDEPLSDYLAKIKRHTGIVVLRVNQ